jgi:rare lipoprotein A
MKRGILLSVILALFLACLWALSTYAAGPRLMVASWYGKAHQGRATASGMSFDRWGLTCAHKTLPLGTWLRVTDPRSHRWVMVRVTDRGPFVPGRDLDLSEQAARQLRIEREGVAWVEVAIIRGRA